MKQVRSTLAVVPKNVRNLLNILRQLRSKSAKRSFASSKNPKEIVGNIVKNPLFYSGFELNLFRKSAAFAKLNFNCRSTKSACSKVVELGFSPFLLFEVDVSAIQKLWYKTCSYKNFWF